MRITLFIAAFIALTIWGGDVAAETGLLHYAQFQPREQSIDERLGITNPDIIPENPEQEKAILVRRYSRNCKARPTEGLSPSAQTYLCGCATKGMREKMSIEDLRSIYTIDENSPAARYKFYTKVYGACLDLPLQRFSLENCQIGNQNIQRKDVRDKYNQACLCASNTLKELMTHSGHVYMERALQLEWANPDPLSVLLNDREFIRKNDGYLKRCIQIHVDGLR